MNIQQRTLIDNTILPIYFSWNELESLSQQANVKFQSYTNDSIIFYESESCDCLSLILCGSVHVSQVSDNGNVNMLANLATNQLIGSSFAFSRTPYYPVSFISKNDVTLLHVPTKIFFDLLTSNISFMEYYLAQSGDCILKIAQTYHNTYKKSIREMIIEYLKKEAAYQNSDAIKLPITKTAIAKSLNIHRTSLSRELTKMIEDELIEIKDSTITLIK